MGGEEKRLTENRRAKRNKCGVAVNCASEPAMGGKKKGKKIKKSKSLGREK